MADISLVSRERTRRTQSSSTIHELNARLNLVASGVACVARGKGIGKKGKREGVGERGEGTPAIRTPFYSFLRTLASANS